MIAFEIVNFDDRMQSGPTCAGAIIMQARGPILNQFQCKREKLMMTMTSVMMRMRTRNKPRMRKRLGTRMVLERLITWMAILEVD